MEYKDIPTVDLVTHIDKIFQELADKYNKEYDKLKSFIKRATKDKAYIAQLKNVDKIREHFRDVDKTADNITKAFDEFSIIASFIFNGHNNFLAIEDRWVELRNYAVKKGLTILEEVALPSEQPIHIDNNLNIEDILNELSERINLFISKMKSYPIDEQNEMYIKIQNGYINTLKPISNFITGRYKECREIRISYTQILIWCTFKNMFKKSIEMAINNLESEKILVLVGLL